MGECGGLLPPFFVLHTLPRLASPRVAFTPPPLSKSSLSSRFPIYRYKHIRYRQYQSQSPSLLSGASPWQRVSPMVHDGRHKLVAGQKKAFWQWLDLDRLWRCIRLRLLLWLGNIVRPESVALLVSSDSRLRLLRLTFEHGIYFVLRMNE
jgi:hypothetical protein